MRLSAFARDQSFVDTKIENKYTSICPKKGLPELLSFMIFRVGESMKKSVFLVFLFLASVCFAQTQSTPPAPATPPATTPPPTAAPATIAEGLNWLIGTWEGEGKSRGVEFLGKLTVTEELDGMGVLANRISTTKTGDPTGGLKELFLIGFDGTTKKIVATLYDNKSAIALFVGEIKNKEVDFSLAQAQAGYANHRIFQLKEDGTLYFLIEGSSPGKEVSKLVEVTFTKK